MWFVIQVLRSSESLPVKFWAAAGRRVSVEDDAFWGMWGLVFNGWGGGCVAVVVAV